LMCFEIIKFSFLNSSFLAILLNSMRLRKNQMKKTTMILTIFNHIDNHE